MQNVWEYCDPNSVYISSFEMNRKLTYETTRIVLQKCSTSII